MAEACAPREAPIMCTLAGETPTLGEVINSRKVAPYSPAILFQTRNKT